MTSYPWSGNVRELRNMIERCVVLEEVEQVAADCLLGKLITPLGNKAAQGARIILPEKGLSLEGLEKDLIRQALERTSFNQTKAANLLGLTYDSLRYQMKKFGLAAANQGR